MRIHQTNTPFLSIVACVLGAAACTVAGPKAPESTDQPVLDGPPSASSDGGAGDPREVFADAGVAFPSREAGADSTAPQAPAPAPVPQPSGADAGAGGVGTGRIAINGICCYGGNYLACPNAAACFGGFDVNACLATCSGPDDPCFDACFAKQDGAGPPVECTAGMTAPPGVDCATGNIHLDQ